MGEDEPEVLGQLAAGILIRCGQRCHQLSFFCIPRGAESITPVRFYCVGLCSRVQGTEESLPDEPGRLDCGQGPHWTAALPSRAQHPRLPCALWFTSSCVALALISPSGAALPLTTTRPCPSSLPTASRTASHRWLRFLSTVKHLEFPSQKSDATHVYHHVRPGDPVSMSSPLLLDLPKFQTSSCTSNPYHAEEVRGQVVSAGGLFSGGGDVKCTDNGCFSTGWAEYQGPARPFVLEEEEEDAMVIALGSLMIVRITMTMPIRMLLLMMLLVMPMMMLMLIMLMMMLAKTGHTFGRVDTITTCQHPANLVRLDAVSIRTTSVDRLQPPRLR